MNDKEIEYSMNDKDIMNKLEEYFGGADQLPCPLNYPKSFSYYVMMYRYFRKGS
jgi:hypothetical protein